MVLHHLDPLVGRAEVPARDVVDDGARDGHHAAPGLVSNRENQVPALGVKRRAKHVGILQLKLAQANTSAEIVLDVLGDEGNAGLLKRSDDREQILARRLDTRVALEARDGGAGDLGVRRQLILGPADQSPGGGALARGY